MMRHFGRGTSLVLLLFFFSFASVAYADVYDVIGTFDTTTYSGPLNGGSFKGTFTATLPISGTQVISTYNIELLNSSNTVLTTLTGAIAQVGVFGTCGDGASSVASCDLFTFFGSDGSFLELATPLGFTGGSVFPIGPTSANFNSFAGYQTNSSSTDSGVSSGSISAVPEPSSLMLLGTGVAGMIGVIRRKLNR